MGLDFGLLLFHHALTKSVLILIERDPSLTHDPSFSSTSIELEDQPATPSWVREYFPDGGDGLPLSVVQELEDQYNSESIAPLAPGKRAEHAIERTVNNLLWNTAFRDERLEQIREGADSREEADVSEEYYRALFHDIDEAMAATGYSMDDLQSLVQEDRNAAIRSLLPAFIYLLQNKGRSVSELRNGYPDSVEIENE